MDPNTAHSSCGSPPAGVPDERRRSKYPMISVEEAILLVLQQTQCLGVENVSLMDSCGRVVAEDIKGIEPFTSFRASIMDGYAVFGDLEPGIYPVQQHIHAGDTTEKVGTLARDHIVYITTGAMVPEGANAVVKIEDTSAVFDSNIGQVSANTNNNNDVTKKKVKSKLKYQKVVIFDKLVVIFKLVK
jgi:gephyrin